VEILFTRHVVEKLEKYLRQLGVSEEDVVTTLREPDDLAYDTLTNRYIALSYAKKLAVVYEREDDKIIVVTAIYSSRLRELVERRRVSGRWI